MRVESSSITEAVLVELNGTNAEESIEFPSVKGAEVTGACKINQCKGSF